MLTYCWLKTTRGYRWPVTPWIIWSWGGSNPWPLECHLYFNISVQVVFSAIWLYLLYETGIAGTAKLYLVVPVTATVHCLLFHIKDPLPHLYPCLILSAQKICKIKYRPQRMVILKYLSKDYKPNVPLAKFQLWSTFGWRETMFDVIQKWTIGDRKLRDTFY